MPLVISRDLIIQGDRVLDSRPPEYPVNAAEHCRRLRNTPKGGRTDAATSQQAMDGPSGKPDGAETRRIPRSGKLPGALLFGYFLLGEQEDI